MMKVDGPDTFKILRGLSAGLEGEIQLVDASNIYANQGFVETLHLN
jgi:hypothetical protein